MRNAILQELHVEYEQRRQENQRENERRRHAAVTACPEIGELLSARQNLIFDSLRGILDGRASAKDLPQQMEVLNKRLASLLTKHGFAPDYLDPVYRCPRCKDTGYVGDLVKEQCECLRTAFFSRLYRRIGLGENGEQSFENFDLSIFSDEKLPDKPFSQRDVMSLFCQQCKGWSEQYPEVQQKNVMMMGQSGLGKTYLMHAMAKVLLERGFNVLLISAYRFLETARKNYFTGDTKDMDVLVEADILMIDDMGAEPLMENITITQWFNLINERQLRGKSTVISTNLTDSELRTRYTERIASRLLNKGENMILQFRGEDVRRRNQQ